MSAFDLPRGLLVGLLVVGALGTALAFARYRAAGGADGEATRDRLRALRAAADSCAAELVGEEAAFRAFDRDVDALRRRAEAYEGLDSRGVPADSYPAYLEAFDRYNEAVPAWEARADTLRAHWEACRRLTGRHNRVLDSLRRAEAGGRAPGARTPPGG